MGAFLTYKKITVIIFQIIIFLNLSQVTFASWEIIKTTSYSNIDTAKDFFHTVFDKGDNQYKNISAWYKKNNNVVTILPYILRVHILNFFMVLLWIFFTLLIVIKYLSK